MLREFIVYVCPVGKLNNQVEKYFGTTRKKFGENGAHQYIPNCTLTGFSRQINLCSDLYSSLRYCLKKCSADSPTTTNSCLRYEVIAVFILLGIQQQK